jgi:hypothetical protein
MQPPIPLPQNATLTLPDGITIAAAIKPFKEYKNNSQDGVAPKTLPMKGFTIGATLPQSVQVRSRARIVIEGKEGEFIFTAIVQFDNGVSAAMGSRFEGEFIPAGISQASPSTNPFENL